MARIQIIIAGGGKIIPEILMKEGSSSYLDSIYLPYSMEATLETIGLEETKNRFVSEEFVLEALESLKNKTQRKEWNKPLTVVFGSCSLFFKDQREGRRNQVFVGGITIDPDGKITQSPIRHIKLDSIQNRHLQEVVVAEYVIREFVR